MNPESFVMPMKFGECFWIKGKKIGEIWETQGGAAVLLKVFEWKMLPKTHPEVHAALTEWFRDEKRFNIARLALDQDKDRKFRRSVQTNTARDHATRERQAEFGY